MTADFFNPFPEHLLTYLQPKFNGTMKISTNTHQIRQQFEIPISPETSINRFVNYFLIEGQKLYLIDTGTKNSIQEMRAYLHKINRSFEDISAIFLTHSHPDHIGSVSELVKQTNCKVYAPSTEKRWIEDVDLQFKERPVPGFFDIVGGSAPVDFCYSDGETIQLEPTIHLTPISVPGHSDGSTCLLFHEDRILFTGDALLLPGELPIYTNAKAYLNSLEKIRAVAEVDAYLSAWDDIRTKNEIATLLDQSAAYVQSIGKAVDACRNLYSEENPMAFCQAVVAHLGMPPFLANHLLLASFNSHRIDPI
jgi:hydroxyacylglutathione hydrolase